MICSVCRYLVCATLLCALPLQAATPRYNPFAQLGDSGAGTGVTAAAANLQLRGVMTGSRGGSANINGTILSVGESFRGYKLLSTDENSAVLLGPAGPVTLELLATGNKNDAR